MWWLLDLTCDFFFLTGFPIKDTLTGVDHEVVLDIPLRCPVQESDTSDSDTDEEASLPSLMLIESSEEVAVESTEVESPVQQLAVQTSKKVIKRSQKRYVELSHLVPWNTALSTNSDLQAMLKLLKHVSSWKTSHEGISMFYFFNGVPSPWSVFGWNDIYQSAMQSTPGPNYTVLFWEMSTKEQNG